MKNYKITKEKKGDKNVNKFVLSVKIFIVHKKTDACTIIN